MSDERMITAKEEENLRRILDRDKIIETEEDLLELAELTDKED